MSKVIKEVVLGANIERLQEAYSQSDYSTDELLAEYIDNSVSASRPGIPVDVDITITKDVMTYSDNGTGIALSQLENALSLGSYTIRSGGMNEHGLGFKQAMFSMGKFIELDSYTNKGESYSIQGKEALQFGLPYNDAVAVNSECKLTTPGLQFKVKINSLVQENFNDPAKLEELVDLLGAKYQDLLKSKKLSINLNIDNKYVSIKPNTPQYWNFKTNTAGALFEKIYKAEDNSWEAKVVIGYVPDPVRETHVYKTQKWMPKSEKLKYSRSINHSGFDIKLGMRVIQHSAKKLSDSMNRLEVLMSNHASNNGVHGSIELIHGFRTQSTKNRLSVTKSLKELYTSINKDTKTTALEIQQHEKSLSLKKKPISLMAEILSNSKVHKKRLNSFETVNPKLYEGSNIKHAIVDKTKRTLYIEPHKYDELNMESVSAIHLDTYKNIVDPNPLDLKNKINRIITLVNEKPNRGMISFALMLPAFSESIANKKYDVKQNDLMTSKELKAHMENSLGLDTAQIYTLDLNNI